MNYRLTRPVLLYSTQIENDNIILKIDELASS